jgi:hypothetical protein
MESIRPVRQLAPTRASSFPSVPRPALRLLWALAPLACFVAMAAWVGVDEIVARLANDDQSYYILVARNLFTRGPTYDGLYLTNGVHPLLALVLGAIFAAFSVPFAQLASVSVLACACFGCALLYVLLGMRPLEPSTRISLLGLLSSFAVYPVLYRGMEGALALLVMALFLRALEARRINGWTASALMIVLWAARLELFAFAPIAILIGGRALSLSRRDTLRWLAAWLVSVLAFGLFAGASYHWIGLALPVSGLIKQGTFRPLPYFIVLGAGCSLAAVAALVVPSLGRLSQRAWRTHTLLAWAGVFYLAHAWGQPDTERQTWYYFVVPGLIGCALIELELGTSLRRSVAASIVAVGLIATLWEGWFVIPLRAEWWSAVRKVTARAKSAAAPGERFMGPGWMALFVGPEFDPFSHDGLVGGVEQYHALRAARLVEFAYESGVRFLVVSSPGAASAPPQLSSPWELQLVSDGVVPSGRSLWSSLSRADDDCGLRRCSATVAVYRLSRGAAAGELAAGQVSP